MKKEKGLTIIELLVTITILVATVTTVVSLGDRAVSNGGLFSAYTQATFLAKEAMEILEDDNARQGIIDAGEGRTYWRLDYENDPAETDSNICNEEKLRVSLTDGYYKIGLISDRETIFSRCVIVDKSGGEIKVEVDVSFDYKNKDYSINLFRIFYE